MHGHDEADPPAEPPAAAHEGGLAHLAPGRRGRRQALAGLAERHGPRRTPPGRAGLRSAVARSGEVHGRVHAGERTPGAADEEGEEPHDDGEQEEEDDEPPAGARPLGRRAPRTRQVDRAVGAGLLAQAALDARVGRDGHAPAREAARQVEQHAVRAEEAAVGPAHEHADHAAGSRRARACRSRPTAGRSRRTGRSGRSRTPRPWPRSRRRGRGRRRRGSGAPARASPGGAPAGAARRPGSRRAGRRRSRSSARRTARRPAAGRRTRATPIGSA